MSFTHWPAPFRGRIPVQARVEIPGSKSVTNRALILAAQATSPSLLRKPLQSRDSELMSAGLSALGVKIESKEIDSRNSAWAITPAPLQGPATIDVGNAGTVMRFLPPLAALARGEISFIGDPRAYERPVGPVIKALAELGVQIDHGGRFSLPLTISAHGSIKGGALTIDASASSQFLSALLLVGPSMENGITVTHSGGALPSMPHIDMTVAMLRDFGADVEINSAEKTWRVAPTTLQGRDFTIEPDLSNAAPFLSIAMACGGEITIADWPAATTQPGDHLRHILSTMGAEITLSSAGLTLKSDGVIHGIDIDLHDVGELTPAIDRKSTRLNSSHT